MAKTARLCSRASGSSACGRPAPPPTAPPHAPYAPPKPLRILSNGSNKAVCCGQAADAREVLAQNLGVPTEDILNTVVTQIHAGDQVNFTLSIVEMIPVQELLPAGWRVSRTIIAGIWVAFFQECQQ